MISFIQCNEDEKSICRNKKSRKNKMNRSYPLRNRKYVKTIEFKWTLSWQY